MGAPAYMPKPSRYQRDCEKWERKQARDKAKRTQVEAERDAWAVVARACYDRDGGCSRASGRPLEYRTANPFKVADSHHIRWRSAGGADDLSNLVTLSREEHDRVHMRGNYKTRLEVSGDANQTLTFREFDAETGKLIREWESPCPQETRA